MPTLIRKVAPISDKEFFDSVIQFDAENPNVCRNVSFDSVYSGNLTEAKKHKHLTAFLAGGGRLAHRCRVDIDHASISLERNKEPNTAGTMDILQISVPDNPEQAAAVAPHLTKLQAAFDKLSAVTMTALMGDELRSHLELRDVSLARLEAAAANIISESVRAAAARDLKLAEREQILEQKYVAKDAEQEALYAEKLKALQEEAHRLDERKKVLDDRAATHARRQHYDDLKTKLEAWAKTFEVSEGTAKLRYWVIVPTTALAIVFGVGAGYFLVGMATTTDTTQIVWMALKQITLTALFVATCSFFIRWSNSWLARHADEEFRLKRLELDLARASWFVEMAFEWNEEKAGPVPQEMVERLTRGLFTDAGAPERDTPAESLAHAIMGASNVSLQLPGGSKVDWNGKQMKEVRRDSQVD